MLSTAQIPAAWTVNYIGNYAGLLLENIKQMAGKEGPYSKQVSIIQSSGTGKSRMVHELAKLVFTIPFNIGDDNAYLGKDQFTHVDLNLKAPYRGRIPISRSRYS